MMQGGGGGGGESGIRYDNEIGQFDRDFLEL